MHALTEELQPMVAKIAEWCGNRPVKRCALFGSQAIGRQRPDSDVDLAIWPDQSPSVQTKLTWLRELKTLLDKSVSLALVSADLNPVLGFEIVRDGRLIYEKQSGLWIKHRAQLWHAYNNSLPFALPASDILHHLLAERGKTAVSYKDAFRLAAREGLLPLDLSERLQNAASMRNALVHMYEEIDYEILHQSIPMALKDFAQFVAIFAEYQTS